MTPNAMPARLTKSPRKPREARPIRNNQLADQLKKFNLKGSK